MTDSSDTPSLNPHFAEVIGFVDASGGLQDGPSENQFQLLINVGTEDDVSVGERVLIFSLGKSIRDPKTGKDLGRFEIVRGEGKVKSVQTRMAVVTSTGTRTELRTKPFAGLGTVALGAALGGQLDRELVTVPAPFKNPEVGDLVRFI